MSFTLQDAKSYEERSDFLSAAKAYQWILDVYPVVLFQSVRNLWWLSIQQIRSDNQGAREGISNLFANPNVTADAMNAIGEMYHTPGTGVITNFDSALKWHQKASTKGNARADWNLGVFYEKGYAVTKSIVTAVKYYQQSLEKGYAEAQTDLKRLFKGDIAANDLTWIGYMYDEGKGVAQNYTDARQWYEKAKEKGSGYAYKRMGIFYEKGLGGVTKNLVTAAKNYRQAIEMGHAGAQADLDQLFASEEISANDLNSVGVIYHNGDGVKKDFAKAKLWYEKAKERGSGAAYRNLGFLHENGLGGFSPNFVIAAKYYQQAREKGHTEARTDLDRLLAKDEIKADDLNQIGVMYHNGDGVIRAFTKAKLWHEKAKEKGSAVAYRNIGFLYENGFSVEKNFVTAAKYYQQAIEKGHPEAQADLERLFNNADISANDLEKVAYMYHNGDGVAQNYGKARQWHEKARDKGSAVAYRNLGILYEYGRGIERNFVIAAKHYQQAIEKGYLAAQEDLDRLFNDVDLTASNLFHIAIMYSGGDNVTQSYVKARKWYEKAITRDDKFPYPYACLGNLYQHGLGDVEKNFVIAAKHYQQAIERGYATSQTDLDQLFANGEIKADDLNQIGAMYHKGEGVQQDFNKARKWYEGPVGRNIPNAKAQLKKLEKDRVVGLVRDEKGILPIDTKDDKNNTALHRAAKDGRLKSCARLLFLGASKDVYNLANKKPFADLVQPNLDKIGRLQTQLAALVTQLEEKAPSILVGKVITDQARLNKAPTEQALDALYEIEQIKPLMDLAKLAGLGLHDLSKRPKFSQADYDSDNDDEEKVSANSEEYLKIRLDARNDTVQGICHHGQDGQAGKDWLGVYTHKNTVFVGGGIRTKLEVRGTLIHELTHFIAYEVFKNNSKPYGENDDVNKRKFETIANNLNNRRNQLHPILQGAFSQSYQSSNQVDGELIVRAAQMIVQCDNGLVLLRAQAPELLDYYENVFLAAVKEHTNKLEARALSDWPKDLFTQSRQNQYSLSLRI